MKKSHIDDDFEREDGENVRHTHTPTHTAAMCEKDVAFGHFAAPPG